MKPTSRGFLVSSYVLCAVVHVLAFSLLHALHDPLGSILDNAIGSKGKIYEYLAANSHEISYIGAILLALIPWLFLSRHGRRRCDERAARARDKWCGGAHEAIDPRVASVYGACFWYRTLRPEVLVFWLFVFAALFFLLPRELFLRRAFPVYWGVVHVLFVVAYAYKRNRFQRTFLSAPTCYRCGYRISEIVQNPESPTADAPFVECSECGAPCPTVSREGKKLVPYWNVRTRAA